MVTGGGGGRWGYMRGCYAVVPGGGGGGWGYMRGYMAGPRIPAPLGKVWDDMWARKGLDMG